MVEQNRPGSCTIRTPPRRQIHSVQLQQLHALILRADGVAQAPLRALQVLHLAAGHRALEL